MLSKQCFAKELIKWKYKKIFQNKFVQKVKTLQKLTIIINGDAKCLFSLKNTDQ